jgi:tRNA nucleotidyltransferase (CCA-adding enzyme)
MTLPPPQQIDGLLQQRTYVYRLLVDAGKLAAQMGMRAAVVGGFVRDLLLGVENEDLDIVIEGDGLFLAEELSRRLNACLKIHEVFGTAMLILPDGKKIDIATARTEYYEFPAALPTVRFSSLRQDLDRRDFTINAMAVDITPDNFGHVLDFFGGYEDLRQGLIRILYSRSFYDDPTRLFRSIRFEQRYGFMLEIQTEQLAVSGVAEKIWQNLSVERLARELILIFKENRCRRILKRLDNIGIWSELFPAIPLDQVIWEGLRRSQQVRNILVDYMPAGTPWLIVPMLLFYRLTAAQQAEYTEMLKLTGRQRANVKATLSVLDETLVRLQQRHLTNAEIYELLQPLSVEGIMLVAALLCHHKPANRRILSFLKELRGIKQMLTGEDIRQLGVKPGPVIGEILRLLHREKLNGGLPTKDDEVWFVKEFVAGSL